MLPKVNTPAIKLDNYRKVVSEEKLEEIEKLARPLKGMKVSMINSTPRGGGVAEILKSLVPLMKGVGLEADWYTIPPREDFFKITKEIHNALQGKDYDFPFSHRQRYLDHIKRSAQLMKDMSSDIWVVHDPQPAGVIQYLPNFHPSICRLHIDLTLPNPDVWKFIAGFLQMYDRIIVSSKDFVKSSLKSKTTITPPAIDPLSAKNIPLNSRTANHILKSCGISLKKPLISQVSRFDPWKDPLGVLKAYQLAKKEIPNLQLALVGLCLAADDPEAKKVYNKVREAVQGDPDVFLFFDPQQLGSLKVGEFVNAVQVGSKVIVQKSIREGFALTVTEAMWKEKAVIGGRVGGIKVQIRDEENGFLAGTTGEAAEKMVKILKTPGLAEEMGRKARQTVQENFLITRLLKDYLEMFSRMKGKKPKQPKKNGELMDILKNY